MSNGLNPFSSQVQGGQGVYQIDFEKLKNMQMISSDKTQTIGFSMSQGAESKMETSNINIDFDINSEMQKFM